MKYTLVLVLVCIGGVMSLYTVRTDIVIVLVDKGESQRNHLVISGIYSSSLLKRMVGTPTIAIDSVVEPSLQCGSGIIAMGEQYDSGSGYMRFGNITLGTDLFRLGESLTVRAEPVPFYTSEKRIQMKVSAIYSTSKADAVCRSLARV